MIKDLIDKAVSPQQLETFAQTLSAFLVRAHLNQIEGNPGKALTALVKGQILDPALDVLKWTGTKEAENLYDAFCDVKIYGTGCAQAAAEAGSDVVDLAWLLSKADISKEEIKASAKLKKRRSSKVKKTTK